MYVAADPYKRLQNVIALDILCNISILTCSAPKIAFSVESTDTNSSANKHASLTGQSNLRSLLTISTLENENAESCNINELPKLICDNGSSEYIAIFVCVCACVLYLLEYYNNIIIG